MRKILKNFESCSQSDEPVHSVMFFGTTVKALGIICVNFHLFRVRNVHPLFCGIPYYVRKVLTNFKNCSELVEPIREPDQLVH